MFDNASFNNSNEFVEPEGGSLWSRMTAASRELKRVEDECSALRDEKDAVHQNLLALQVFPNCLKDLFIAMNEF